MGTAFHIVQVKFQDGVDDEQIQEVCQHIFTLKDKCIHPKTRQQYVKSLTGGRNSTAKEDLDENDMTHTFVIEFENAEDREYYVHSDPDHLACGAAIGGLAAGVRMVDYEHGVV